MNHIAVAAVATALVVGAGTGTLTHEEAADVAFSDVSNPMIAGQAMLLSANLLDNASRSPEHRMFVAAARKAGLASLLEGKGEFTVFAPTDQAFSTMLRTRADFFRDRANAVWRKAIRYMVVQGRWDSQAMLRLINENEGEARLKSLDGGHIRISMNGPTNIVLMDENGGIADIAIYDINQSNGVMHVIDHVLTPHISADQRFTKAVLRQQASAP